MKLIFKTFALISSALVMAFLGRYLHAIMQEEILLKSLRKEADFAYSKYLKEYNSAKKTFVVLGVSTSILSFPENKNESISAVSYVDLLKNKVNVLNLSSNYLRNENQARELLRFALEKIPKIDLIILENSRFLKPREMYQNDMYINELINCSFGNSFKTSTSSLEAKNNSFAKTECKKVFREGLNYFLHVYKLSYQPCLKKYQKEMEYIIFGRLKDNSSIFSSILSCSLEYTNVKDVQLELLYNFSYGYFQELENGFKKNRLDIYSFKNEDFLQFSDSVMKIIYNRSLTKIKKMYSGEKIIVTDVGSFLNDFEFVKIPILKNNESSLSYLSILNDVNKVIKSSNLKFGEVYPDGSHSKFWLHKILAEKLILKNETF
jgi:hypothetical protein